jgi:hypothetical protein
LEQAIIYHVREMRCLSRNDGSARLAEERRREAREKVLKKNMWGVPI